MNCIDAAEYVSALCDGEIIPPSAAEHIGVCPDCQRRLRDYMGIGAELRRTASLELAHSVPTLVWTKPQNRLITWWQKGLATMRIPRLAFALLVVGVIALASSLAVVKVRAHDDGTVVLLSISFGGASKPVECPLSTVDKQFQVCSLMGFAGDNGRGYKFELLSRHDSRVQLRVRAGQLSVPLGRPVQYADLDNLPEQQFWFEPGDTLKIDATGFPTLTVKGAWLDHVPSFMGADGSFKMDPGPGELRLYAPLLLRDKEVIGDLGGGMSTATTPDSGVSICIPKHGRYLIANSRLRDAIEAHVLMNRILFEENGHEYAFLTGAPVSRAQHVWVLHDPDYSSGMPGTNEDFASIGPTTLEEAEPGIWVSKDRRR